MGFANACGTKKEDILFLIKGSLLTLQREAHMLEVIAQSHAENLLGFVLANDKAVQMPGDICRFQAEGKILRGGWLATDGDLRDRWFADAAQFFRNACCDRTECGWFHEMFSSLSMATSRS